MPIASSDIQFRLSGGASNTDPNASLGGAKSNTQIAEATLHNLFDIVSSAEALSGDTEYRCFYIHNNHGSLTLENAKVYIETNTPSVDTSVEIGLGAAAVNGTETAIANESQAPAGVTFSTPSQGSPLVIGNIPPGQHKAVWVKRIVNEGAQAYNSDNVVIKVEGDTAA